MLQVMVTCSHVTNVSFEIRYSLWSKATVLLHKLHYRWLFLKEVSTGDLCHPEQNWMYCVYRGRGPEGVGAEEWVVMTWMSRIEGIVTLTVYVFRYSSSHSFIQNGEWMEWIEQFYCSRIMSSILYKYLKKEKDETT